MTQIMTADIDPTPSDRNLTREDIERGAVSGKYVCSARGAQCIWAYCTYDCPGRRDVHAPPATSPPRTPEQYDADAKALHIVICRMRRLAPSLLYPLLAVARSMMKWGPPTETNAERYRRGVDDVNRTKD